MKTLGIILLLAGALLFAGHASAQDVNNRTDTLMDRPQGPPSQPAVMVPGTPAVSQPPSADPNAPLEGRATTTPSAERPPKADRGTGSDASRRMRDRGVAPTTGSDAGGK